MDSPILVIPLLAILLFYAINGGAAVQYSVTNNAGTTSGSTRFTNEIGIPYTQQAMASATDFIWRAFQQTNAPADRKNVQQVCAIVNYSYSMS